MEWNGKMRWNRNGMGRKWNGKGMEEWNGKARIAMEKEWNGMYCHVSYGTCATRMRTRPRRRGTRRRGGTTRPGTPPRGEMWSWSTRERERPSRRAIVARRDARRAHESKRDDTPVTPPSAARNGEGILSGRYEMMMRPARRAPLDRGNLRSREPSIEGTFDRGNLRSREPSLR